MKFNSFNFTLSILLVFLLSSCKPDIITVSNDATFVSLTFGYRATNPNLSTAVFSLDGNTIVNLDSLPYKTRIDTVMPLFNFMSTKAILLCNAKDTIQITANDTVNFQKYSGVKNYATDGVAYRIYGLKVNVHQMDPEQYDWRSNITALNNNGAKNQKAVLLKEVIYYYENTGSDAFLYTTVDGININPSGVITPVGFPTNSSLADMTELNGKLYLTDQNTGKLLVSADGVTWASSTITNYDLKTLLFPLNNKLCAVLRSKADSKYRFASSVDGVAWLVYDEIPANFPTTGFASTPFASRTGKPRGIVMGGYTPSGTLLRNCWSTEDGIYWVDFSTENRTLGNLAGGAVIPYDNKLLLIGGTDSVKNYLRESIDEGLSWRIPDSTHNILPKEFVKRKYHSAFVQRPAQLRGTNIPSSDAILSNNIFIVGGKSATGTQTDIWYGKLNKKKFKRQ